LATFDIDPLMDSSWFLALRARDKVALGEIEPRTFSEAVRAIEAWDRFRPTPEKRGIPFWAQEQDIVNVIEEARRHMTVQEYDEFITALPGDRTRNDSLART